MSAALFSRRSRSGWLDELDGVRDDALASPDGDVATAMAAVGPISDSDTSPLAELEAPLPAAAPSTWADASPEPAAPMAARPELLDALIAGNADSVPDALASIDDRPEPPVPAAVAVTHDAPPPPPHRASDPVPPPSTDHDAAPAPDAAPAADAELDLSTLPPPPAPAPATEPSAEEPSSASDHDVVAPTDDVTAPSTSALPPPPPPQHAVTGPISFTPDQADLDAEPPAIPIQPSPHPVRPQEMWHPQLVVGPPERTEERLDQAELLGGDESTTSARFRFARLRAVSPEGTNLVADAPPPSPPVSDPEPPTGEANLRPQVDLFSADRATEVEAGPLGIGAAPLVPSQPTGASGSLINGPVARRSKRRRGSLFGAGNVTAQPTPSVTDAALADATSAGTRTADEPSDLVDAVAPDAPTDAPTEVDVVAPVSAAVDAAPAPGLVDLPEPIDFADALVDAAAGEPEPVAPDLADVPNDAVLAEPEPVAPDVAAPADIEAEVEIEAPVDVSVEVEAVEPLVFEVRDLAVASDGSVAVDHGSMRLAEGVTPTVLHGPAGIELDLSSGWCWAERPAGSAPVTVALAAGTLTVPAGTTALAVVEADQSNFVLVVSGEAQLLHPGGRMRLRAGAMALAPLGQEPQVDVATEPEILSDPLVQHNRQLDAQR